MGLLEAIAAVMILLATWVNDFGLQAAVDAVTRALG